MENKYITRRNGPAGINADRIKNRLAKCEHFVRRFFILSALIPAGPFPRVIYLFSICPVYDSERGLSETPERPANVSCVSCSSFLLYIIFRPMRLHSSFNKASPLSVLLNLNQLNPFSVHRNILKNYLLINLLKQYCQQNLILHSVPNMALIKITTTTKRSRHSTGA